MSQSNVGQGAPGLQSPQQQAQGWDSKGFSWGDSEGIPRQGRGLGASGMEEEMQHPPQRTFRVTWNQQRVGDPSG